MKKSVFKIFIAHMALLFVLLACAHKEKTHWGSQIKNAQGMLNAFKTEIMVETEVFIDDTINLINPFTLKIVDGQLIVRNNVDYDKKHFSVFNFQSRKFIGKSFSFGHGPNEYLRVRPFSFSDDTLLVIDVLKSEALLFSRQKINECSDIPDRRFKFKNLKAGEQIEYCIQFDNMLVCSGLFHEGRFKAFNTSGDLLSGFGKYPEINAKIEIDPFQMGSLFYQVSFAKDSRQNKLAVFDEHSFSIFKKENKSFSQIMELTWNIPPAESAGYMEGRPYVVRSGKDYWIGTGHIVSNDKYIFVPFSEYDNNQVIKQGIEDMFAYILVFDWDGNPVAKLKSDNNISITLEIDKQGKYLYSIQSDQQTGFKRIVRIKIPDQFYVPYNINTGYSLPNDTSDFKIVTYLNLYCDPCWENITLWKSFIKENPEFSQVSFFIFIGATLDDFERENANSNFDFPVFLDINQRFRIVNQLGSDPNQLTFLCNKNNEVLFNGLPFSPEKKDRYLQIITAQNYPE